MLSIVVKIGTNVLTEESGSLNLDLIKKLTEQINKIHKKGIRVLIVSSGSIGAGRSLLTDIKKGDEIEKRQVLSSIGQAELVGIYKRFFRKQGIQVAQILPTKLDFQDRNHYLNIKRCLDGLWKNKIIPIINENDTVSIRELMFTDNDELAGLISSMINSDALIIATNVDGIFDGSPNNPNSKLIKNIDAGRSMDKYIHPEKSEFGRGGMLTKIGIAQKIAKLGINVFIVNGKKENFLHDVVSGKNIGTKISAKDKNSNIKRWLAFSEKNDIPSITIDAGLSKIIRDTSKALSVLPIGVAKIDGSFKKGDLIEIRSHKGVKIGVGLAEYTSNTAKKNLGKKNKKALIHYNNLYLNQ